MTRAPGHAPLLTRSQLSRLETLPDDYRVVSAIDGIPIVESPNGQTLRLQANGRLAATELTEKVRSKMHVQHG
jgi:hypothetical protein